MAADTQGKIRSFLRVVKRGQAEGARENGKCPGRAQAREGVDGEATPESGLARWVWQRARMELGNRENLRWLAPFGISLLTALALTPLPWGLSTLPTLLGLAVIGTVFLRLIYLVWFRRLKGIGAHHDKADLMFLGSVVVLLAVVARAYLILAQGLTLENDHLNLSALGFGLPLMAGPMLVALFLGLQASLLVALAGSFLASLLWPDSAGFFAYFFLTSMVAAHQVHTGHTRTVTLKSGMTAALTGMLVITGLALYRGWMFTVDFPVALGSGLISGLFAAILVAGLAPLAEMAFGYVSNFRLLELASLDHPLLRELMLQAPGTYHHSLVVSSLVEAAAKDIGANPRLAKVAGLYHDLGKLKKAAYFVENQNCGGNRHEKLAPSMSALILISHVKEGVETARKHRLGKGICDIIAQHHGTRLIHFFYHKAAEQRRAAGQADPDMISFRYPGPRPQTREAGLVLLADVVEAASRALDNPTPARLQGLVQTQINRVFVEGELDECELTLKDLHKIAKIFNKILSGIFHQRIEYPKTEDEARKKSDSGDRQPGARACDKPAKPQDPDQTDIKRLGIG